MIQQFENHDPEHQRITFPDARFYTKDNVNWLPGVTTILNVDECVNETEFAPTKLVQQIMERMYAEGRISAFKEMINQQKNNI